MSANALDIIVLGRGGYVAAIHAHPTIAEGVMEAARGLSGAPIHI